MADVQFGKNEFNALLAMLTHEGANGIVKLLNAGKTEDAFRYTAGLIDTWTNRAAGSGRSLISEMSRPGQITDWVPDQSVINKKAGSLDSRIRDMASAYMNDRVNGADPLFPKTNFYLNKDLVDYFNTVDPQKYSTNYHKWYDNANDVQAYGFRGKDGNGGRSSTETQFVANGNERKVPDNYSLVSRGDLNLKPTEAAQRAYFQARGRQAISLDQQNAINAGLGHVDVSEGLGFPGYATSPDGRTAYYAMPDTDAAPKQPVGTDVLSSIGKSVTSGLEAARDAIGQTFGGVLNRLPSADEFQGRLNDVASGTRSLFDQLTDIAGSAEAKTFAQSTGIDPSRYVLDDIYRLGLNRGVDAPSEAAQLEVLRNQGGQSLYNQLINSQEGRTLALGNFYESNLNRGIDQGGLGKYLADLAAGKSMQAVQTEILSSPEAQALGIRPDQFASIIGSAATQYPVGPGATQYPVGPGQTQYPVGPGSTTYPVGPGGFEVGTVPPGPTQGTINTGTEVRPVGPEGYETGVVGAPEATQAVNDIFEAYLQRAPDAQGAVEYQGQIQRGVSPSIVEAQVLASPEAKALPPERYQGLVQNYQAKYGLLPEEVQTVAPLAEDFAKLLHRPADSKTLQAWDQQIDAGTPLSILEAQLIQAPEVQAVGAPALSKLVQDYQTQYALKPEEVTAIGPLASEFARVLDRPADIETIRAWDGQLDAGATMPELEARLLQAPEVLGRTGGAGDAYTAFQGQYGRSPVDYLAALTDPTKFSGANVSGNVGPGSFSGFNGAEYLAANRDVAASGMDPLAHFVKYGLGEGRALDTAGHHLSQNFDGTAYLAQNQDVARAGMNPLEHYLMNGAREGRAAPTGGNPFSFTAANVSQGAGPIGNGTFSGTYNGNDYLAANRDVAASGMDPLEHFLRYGYGEGRAVDTQGDRLPVNFDGNAYLAQNRDVAAAGMDPLRHFLTAGAAEGRAAPTGGNPYSFSNFNVAGGLGSPGNGSFGLGGITSSAPGGMGTIAPAQQAGSSSVFNPFGFSSLNAGTYAAPAAPSDIPTGGFAPNWESASNNALPGSGGRSGSAWEYTDPVTGEKKVATFDPQKSENAYLAGQVAQNQAQIEAGRLSVANNPNLWNFGASNLLNSVAASSFQPGPIYSTASPATYALPSPTGPTFNSPLPVMQQGLRVNPYGGFGLISAF